MVLVVKQAPQFHPPLAGLRLGLVIAICLGFSGCGNADRAKIIGDWEMAVGKDLLEGVVEIDETAAPDPQSEDPIFQPPKMLLKFFRSGALETQTNMGSVRTKKQGYWKLISVDEGNRQLTIECELMGQTTNHEVELIDDKTIRLVPPNLAGLKRQIKFVRQ